MGTRDGTSNGMSRTTDGADAPTADTGLGRHLDRALDEAEDGAACYHIRSALQHLEFR